MDELWDSISQWFTGGDASTTQAGVSAADAAWTTGDYMKGAGAVMAGLGLLTDNKSLRNIGALVLLGGQVSNMAGGAAPDASPSAQVANTVDAAQQQPAQPSIMDRANAATQTPSQGMTTPDLGALNEGPPGEAAQPAFRQTDGYPQAPQAQGGPAQTPGQIGQTLTTAQPGPIGEASQRMTTQEVDKRKNENERKSNSILAGLGGFIKDNKDLLNMVGQKFSPDQQKIDLDKQRFGAEQGIIARRYANMNSPVRMGTIKPPGG